MSAGYKTVLWNRQKKRYDALLAGGVGLYLATFIGLGLATSPDVTAETLLIRGLGTAALILLTIILSIGPLARLDARFLPLLYNRRHMGVTMFLLGAGHGVFSIIQFHALGDMNPLVSVLVSNTATSAISSLPFQPLGLIALMILFLMAATSHDFWLSQLTAPIWKALHMGVYLAYGLILLHVALGVLQSETSPVLAGALLLSAAWVVGLHLVAGSRESAADVPLTASPEEDGFVAVCRVEDIPESAAHGACLSGERIAIYRYEGKVSAISGVCRHQNGPLAEGRIIDGCITCPWHGYQYRPETGASPPPFTETVPTFRVRVLDGQVFVHPTPLPPGTRVEPALTGELA
jgi:sulfoxide reductase heme-binding subunit YedZ